MTYCEYIKTNKGYATSCGIVINHIGRKWIYCPHCGKCIYVKATGRK